MKQEKIIKFAGEIKEYIYESIPYSNLSDEELLEEIEKIVLRKTEDIYMSIDLKIKLTDMVFSSIRGLGILDSILSDDSITEG